MRTKLLALATCVLTLASCVDDCDHSDLWDKINEQETRIEALEDWQQVVNNNLASLQQLVSQNDYITKVTPVALDGQTVGYTIEFKNSPSITLYNGTKGDPGNTPQICLVKQEDGNWYWTLNGELMTDAEGNPIRANGQDGQDGKPGEDGQDGNPGAAAPTPQLLTGSQLPEGAVVTDGGTITPDAVYLSVDGRKTWTKVSGNKGDTGDKGENGSTGEQGEKGDSFFKEVKTDEEGYYVTFVLTDDTKIILPTAQWANAWEKKVNALNTNVQTLQALVSGKQYITSVEKIAGTPGGYTIHLVDAQEEAQTVTILNGKDGEKGETGDKGDNGNNGVTPTVEIKDGTWWINGTDTKINATGAQGATGSQGESGKTPTFQLTTDGNLQYRFDEDEEWITLGNVKGEKGETGDNGADGEKGEQGLQGPQGDAIFANNGVTVNSEEGYVTFTLAEDKGSFTIPLYQDLKLTFTDSNILTNGKGSYSSKITIGYSIGGNDAANASVSAVTDNDDWKVTAISNSEVKLEAPGAESSTNLMLFLVGKDGRSIVYTVRNIRHEAYTVSSAGFTIEGDDKYIIKGNVTQTTGQIIIRGNAKVTLQNVNIKPSTAVPAITIESGTPTLFLEGENNVEGGGGENNDGRAGIYVKENTILTIEGNGKLKATGAKAAAGIGGYSQNSCGQIIIRSGAIVAQGGVGGAGIGGASGATCQGITITGGNITSHTGFGFAVSVLGGCCYGNFSWDENVKNQCEFVRMSNCTINVNNLGIAAKEITPDVNNEAALEAANVIYTKE